MYRLVTWYLEDTDTSFDELFEKFGRKIAVLTLSLTKNKFVIDVDDDSSLTLTKRNIIKKTKAKGIRNKA